MKHTAAGEPQLHTGFSNPASQPLRIVDVRTQIVNLGFRNAVIVQVETDQGITGIAETVMKRRTRSIEQAILAIRPYLIGKDATEIENHWEKMYRDSFWVGGPMHATPISAIDCALWDILGQACGLPVYKLLGGPTRRQIPVYCHCPSGPTPEIFAERVRGCVARGYRAVKTTLPLFYGTNGSTEQPDECVGYSGTAGSIAPAWKETEYLDPSVFRRIREFFQAAREAGGPHLGLALDCHGRLGLKAAIRLCRQLEDLDLLFIEEPIPPENPDALAIVHRETSIPVASGERWATVHGVRPFLEKQAVDILQCDLVNAGGLTAMKKIAGMAEAYYVSMAPHNPNGPIATVMNLHYAASISNFLVLETIGSEYDEAAASDVVMHFPVLQDGFLSPPAGPGFGLKLNESGLARHPYKYQAGWR